MGDCPAILDIAHEGGFEGVDRASEGFVAILVTGMSFGHAGKAGQDCAVGIAFQSYGISQHDSSLLETEILLDFPREPFADFLGGAVHREHGEMPAQSDLEVASIAGFECAALSFQPALELGAGQLRIQQMCWG
jgi:hypothetical protein